MNILIVDDDSTNLLILSSILKAEGYTVETASDGAEAVEKFTSELFELVLMDVMMPVMDGYQATLKIKELSKDRFVPVIFLTAITDEYQLAQCVESGGDDFLTKPYNRVILRSKINAMARIQGLYDVVQKQKEKLTSLNQKIEDDLDLAKHVYDSILSTTKIDPIIDSKIIPVAGFNGDVVLSVKNNYGGYHLMLGDFTGHGLAASFGTIPVADLFYRMTETGYKIADIAVEINNKLNLLLPTGYFCAACFISLDKNGNRIEVFNAGIPDVLLIQEDSLLVYPSVHLPLGVTKTSLSKLKFSQTKISSPSRLVVYSDGVVEAKNTHDILFGTDSLKKLFKNNIDIELDDVVNEIEKFRGDYKQDDDLTIASVKLPFISDKDPNIASVNQVSYDWYLELAFNSHFICHQQPVMNITSAIMSQNIPDCHKDKIFTIITELYNNSLEHGILGLDSALKSSPEGFSDYYMQRELLLSELTEADIKINITNKSNDNGGTLIIEQKDSGNGFDYNSVRTPNSNIYSGRGIILVRSLCKSLTYSENGTRVIAEYVWDYD